MKIPTTLAELLATEEVKAAGINSPMNLIASIKSAADLKKGYDTMVTLTEKMIDSQDGLQKALNRIELGNITRDDAETMQELEKQLGTLGALDPNSVEYRNAKQLLERAYGEVPVAIASKDGLTKAITEPIHPDVTKNYADKKNLRKTWDRAFAICRLKGGLSWKSGSVDGEIGMEIPVVELSVLTSVVEMLEKAKDPGASILKGVLQAKAYDTINAGQGADWVPVIFSSDVAEEIFLETRVASLFATFEMTSSKMSTPYVGTGLAYRMTQAALANQYFTNLATESEPVTGMISWDAEKLGAVRFYSQEIMEDSIIEIADIFLADLIRAHAWAIEEWLLNGSALLNNLDNAGTDTNRLFNNTADGGDGIRLNTGALDPRNAGEGIRRWTLLQGNSRVDASGSATDFGKKCRSLRAVLADSAATPDQLAYIMGVDSHIHTMNDPNFNTLDKFGPNAAVLSGALTKLDGIDIVLSRFQRNIYNATGVFDNVTENLTLTHLVHRKAIKIGMRSAPTLAQGFQALAQQHYLLMTQRLDIQKVLPATVKTFAELFNIPRA